jgi:hypothetical protein
MEKIRLRAAPALVSVIASVVTLTAGPVLGNPLRLASALKLPSPAPIW